MAYTGILNFNFTNALYHVQGNVSICGVLSVGTEGVIIPVLKAIARQSRRSMLFFKKRCVLGAKVPIVTLGHISTGIELDVSIETRAIP